MLQIDLTNRRTMVESLNRDDFKKAAEVGVRTGWFAKYILDHTNMKVYAVDPWENNAELSDAENVFLDCQQRLAPYADRCEIRSGGVLSGHDYNKIKWIGVVRAVEEFCEENNLKFYLTGTVGNAFESKTGDLGEYDGDEHSWFIVKGKNQV